MLLAVIMLTMAFNLLRKQASRGLVLAVPSALSLDSELIPLRMRNTQET